jgi:outer membrane protein insertion porin family
MLSKESRISFRPALLAASLMAAFAPWAAWAVEPFKLKDIRIEGLQRTDAGTVFASLPFRQGDTYTDDKGAAAIRALFATGLFKDVRIEIEGEVVVVVIDERSVIANLDFVGLKEFDKDTLTKTLKDFGIGAGQPFDKSLADRAEQELKRQYLAKSHYGAEVVTTITPLERNRVNVTFTVKEGAPAKIRNIRILGSSAFSESELKEQLKLQDRGWFNWYTKADRYSSKDFKADLEALRSFYLNQGYLEYREESTEVSISADKQDMALTVRISEGRPYTISEIRLEGEFLGKDAEFKGLVLASAGQTYAADAFAATARLFKDRFGVYGYAFPTVEARTELDKDKAQVVVTLFAQPQRRNYVRKVNITGNARTRDEVIRREVRQFEASWYDGAKIKFSRDRIDRLGYFSEVTVDNEEVPGSPDQVDVTYKVKEKPTGSLQATAGYSGYDGITFSVSYQQENALGSGQSFGSEVSLNRYNRAIRVLSTDPYFTADGISRTVSVGYFDQLPFSSQTANGLFDFKSSNPYVNVNFGVPFNDFDTVFFGLGVTQTVLSGRNLPAYLFKYREFYGERSLSIPFTIGWARDTRDNLLNPLNGRLLKFNLDWGMAGDLRYLSSNAQAQQYLPLGRKFTLGLNATLGYGMGLQGKPFPSTKSFFAGGLGSVRNYQSRSLGPTDVLGATSGGSKLLLLNSELFLPVPGTGSDRSLRWFTYADAGNVWGEHEKIDLKTMRASVGLGLSWQSPMGPLKLSWGVPVRERPGDRVERFQFQIGNQF